MDFSKPAWYAELGRELAHSLTPTYVPNLANQIDLRRYLLSDALLLSNDQSRIAVFFDEVEGVSKARDTDGTPFSDTFFMTLRNIFVQRDDYKGTLVVALAGAVNPGELVKDPTISPFNVGEEIGLDDLTVTEARALTEHLANLSASIDESVHRVIFDWTNGHPYLTQRICSEIEKAVNSIPAITANDVNKIVEHIILNPSNPLQWDKNLRHVAKMLAGLSKPADRLWSRLQASESIALAETSDDLFLELYLTGVVRLQVDHLVVRNRIYERAFMRDEIVSPKTSSWTTEQKVQIILDYRRTRTARCSSDGAILDVIEAGTFGNPYAIMANCPICHNSFESDEVEDSVKGRAVQTGDMPTTRNVRLLHLADNIRQDLELLKDYEDTLRYEDDPRRQARYRREIEQLRSSADRYQQEYSELKVQSVGEPSSAMQEVAAQLNQMDTKLGVLLAGQTAIRNDLGGLRQIILACFDANEQSIVAAIVTQLNQNQLMTVQAVLDAIEMEQLPVGQLHETLVAMQHVLTEIQQGDIAFGDSVISHNIQQMAEIIAAPQLDIKHKFKIMVPIIPLIFSYEGEVELGSGLNLESAWRRLIIKVRGR